jgi:RNA polymerase sigma-70 factor (ECF subfamily)
MARERTNEEWRRDLTSPGPAQEKALEDLRAIIVHGLPYALSKWLSPTNPQFDALVEESAQDTLLRVLSHLDTFEGRSKLTTWAHKIAVRIAITELRRKRWQDTSLDRLLGEDVPLEGLRLMTDPKAGPEAKTEQAELVAEVQRIIAEELTEKQKKAMIAAKIHGMPIEEVARSMDTTRNALYKLLHDARLRLKRRMEEEGLSPEDVLSAFEER